MHGNKNIIMLYMISNCAASLLRTTYWTHARHGAELHIVTQYHETELM